MKRSAFTQITIIQAALIASTVMITIFMIILSLTEPINGGNDSELTLYFLLASMLLTFGAILGGKLIYNSIIATGRSKELLQDKMEAYLKGVILRFAIMELAAIFAAVSIYLTGSLYFLVLIAIVFFFFIVERPSKEKIAMDLNLSPEERLMI